MHLLPFTPDALPLTCEFRLLPIACDPSDSTSTYSCRSPVLFHLLQQTYRQSHLEWGVKAGLTLQQYLLREKNLDATLFVKKKKWAWILISKADYLLIHTLLEAEELSASSFQLNPETLEALSQVALLAHCETFKRPCLVYDANSDISQLLDCFAVASVFVPEAHRNKGYGSLIMQLLRIHLCQTIMPENLHQPWGNTLTKLPCDINVQDATKNQGLVVSYLYSDIGKEFYRRFGWFAYPSKEIVVDVAHFLQSDPSRHLKSVPELMAYIHRKGWQAVTYRHQKLGCGSLGDGTSNHQEDFAILEEEWMEEAIALLSSSLDDEDEMVDRHEATKHRAIILPTMDGLIWHWARAETYFHFLPAESRAGTEQPLLVGVMRQDTGHISSLFWTLDFPNKALVVLLAHPWQQQEVLLDPSTLKILLSVSDLYGLRKIIWWLPNDKIVEFFQGDPNDPNGENVQDKVSFHERTSTLPSLAVWHPDGHGEMKSLWIEWKCCERYAWV